LLAHLHRVFDKSPREALALRIGYAGDGLSWTIADETLATQVTGGAGDDLTVSLADHTVASLAAFIAAAPGYSVSDVSADLSGRSALILLDGAGDVATSNGNRLMAYTSLLWALLHPWARALKLAATDIAEAVKQVSLDLAEGEYLDYHGDYYGLRRIPGESDDSYLSRLIAYVLIARNNNVAIQVAIAHNFGISPDLVQVVDADLLEYGVPLVHNGAVTHDGAKWHNGRTVPREIGVDRALFDVMMPASVYESSDVVGVVNQFKAAGTHLRRLLDIAELRHDGMAVHDGRNTHNARILTT
jgi:hypothetical protein